MKLVARHTEQDRFSQLPVRLAEEKTKKKMVNEKREMKMHSDA